MLGVYSLVLRTSQKIQIFLIVLIHALAIIVKFIIVFHTGNYPVADSYLVLESANAFAYNFNYIPDYLRVYLSHIPRQLGLVTLWIPLVKLFQFNLTRFLVFQVILIQASLALIAISLYQWKGIRTALVGTILFNLFIPNSFLVLWVYGEPYTLFFLALALLFYSQRKRHSWYEALMYVSLSLAYLARVTTNLWILSLILVVVLQKMDLSKKTVTILALLTCLILPYQALNLFYNPLIEQRPYPSNSWIRIGTGYSGFDGKTAAYYNDQIETDFMVYQENTNQMAQYNNEIILENVETLWSTHQVIPFIIHKLEITWTDPDFEMMTRMYPFYGSKLESPEVLSQTVMYGSAEMNYQPTSTLGTWLQAQRSLLLKFEKAFMLGLFSLVLLVLFMRKKKDVEDLFFIVVWLAHFAFYLLVEVKGRYTFILTNGMILYLSLHFEETFSGLLAKASRLLKKA